jgi:hypothetical protein
MKPVKRSLKAIAFACVVACITPCVLWSDSSADEPINGSKSVPANRAARNSRGLATYDKHRPRTRAVVRPSPLKNVRASNRNPEIEYQPDGMLTPPALQDPMEDTGPDFVATSIVPDSSARGEALGIQRRFAAAFAEFDTIVPPERVAHFNWLPHHDGVRHIGWAGSILDSAARDDGSWLVKIKLVPVFYSTSMKTAIADFVEETYLVNEDTIMLVHSDATTPKPLLQHFPVAF